MKCLLFVTISSSLLVVTLGVPVVGRELAEHDEERSKSVESDSTADDLSKLSRDESTKESSEQQKNAALMKAQLNKDIKTFVAALILSVEKEVEDKLLSIEQDLEKTNFFLEDSKESSVRRPESAANPEYLPQNLENEIDTVSNTPAGHV